MPGIKGTTIVASGGCCKRDKSTLWINTLVMNSPYCSIVVVVLVIIKRIILVIDPVVVIIVIIIFHHRNTQSSISRDADVGVWRWWKMMMVMMMITNALFLISRDTFHTLDSNGSIYHPCRIRLHHFFNNPFHGRQKQT
jgi:hypothetical protein